MWWQTVGESILRIDSSTSWSEHLGNNVVLSKYFYCEMILRTVHDNSRIKDKRTLNIRYIDVIILFNNVCHVELAGCMSNSTVCLEWNVVFPLVNISPGRKRYFLSEKKLFSYSMKHWFICLFDIEYLGMLY